MQKNIYYQQIKKKKSTQKIKFQKRKIKLKKKIMGFNNYNSF